MSFQDTFKILVIRYTPVVHLTIYAVMKLMQYADCMILLRILRPVLSDELYVLRTRVKSDSCYKSTNHKTIIIYWRTTGDFHMANRMN